MKKPELLIPAGSLDRLKTAFMYGADAVYCGTPSMSLRAKSKFSMEEVKEGVRIANSLGKKVYLTVNLFAHNADIEKLPEYARILKEIKPHGAIVADVAVFKYLRENVPELNLHVSTQSSICSWLGVQFWAEQGAKMCVLAREVSMKDIKIIKEKCKNIKIETFIHGSMCMSYSGRCLLSNFMANRGANQGNCAHSCRWLYKLHLKLRDGTLKELELNEDNVGLFEFLLEEEFRPDQMMEIVELEDMSNILNSKDLCLLPKLNEFAESEIDCLKVEGRNKTQYYVAMVTKVYRQAIDDYARDPENWNCEKYLDDLYSISNRGFSLAFYDGRPTHLANNYNEVKSLSEFEFMGFIQNVKDEHFEVFVKNRIDVGDEIEFISPTKNNIKLNLKEIVDLQSNEKKEFINPGLEKLIKIPFVWFDVPKQELIDALPALTVIKQSKKLSPIDKARVEMDREAYRLELGVGTRSVYEEKKEHFENLLANQK